MAAARKPLLLFDVDGTLTAARRRATPEMLEFLANARKRCSLAVVGGSDMPKIVEQLGDDVREKFDYVFSENGLVGFRGSSQLPGQSVLSVLGEDRLQQLINFALRYFSDLVLPKKRGNFVEFRTSMINFSPIGRSCSQAERDEFVEYDKTHKIREQFVEALQRNFSDFGLTFAIGGQISVDVFPNGWDKTYCLRFLEDTFGPIHFFGDKTSRGGNDYDIYEDARTVGHTVKNPDDTRQQVEETLKALGL